MTPGPLLPTVVAAALAARHLPADGGRRVLPGLVDGTTPAAVPSGAGPPGPGGPGPDGSLHR